MGRREVAKSLFCSTSLLNYSLHFMGVAWFRSAAPRPSPGFPSFSPQESHKSFCLLHPTHSSTGVADKDSVLARRCHKSTCCHKPTLALARASSKPMARAQERQWQAVGTPNFLHPHVHKEGSILDPGPAGIKCQASPQFAPSGKHRQIGREGRKCLQSKFLPAPSSSSVQDNKLKSQLEAHFANIPFFQMAQEPRWGPEGGGGGSQRINVYLRSGSLKR